MSDPQGVSCPHRFLCLLFLKGFNNTLKTETSPSNNHPPFLPAPCPSIPTCVPLSLTNYDLMPSQHTHSDVWKTPCSHSMEPLSSCESSQFTALCLSSGISSAQRKEDLRLTSSKPPQIFTSFPSRWFGCRATQRLCFLAHHNSSRLQWLRRKSFLTFVST